MNKRTIIILIVALVVIFIVYQALTGTSSSTSSLSADVQSSDSTDATYIYSLLQQMQAVKLDDSIFANPIFQNLKDNTVSFSPQASGRPNPFAPIGVDSQTGTTSAASSSGPTH